MLISPSNEEFGPVEPGRAAEILRDGKVCGSIIGSRIRPTIRDNATTGKPNDPVSLPGEDRADGRHVILLQLDTKETRDNQWKVRLQVKAAATPDSIVIPFHAWLERDDEGQSGIRRSLSNRWIQPRDREATIGTLSCGEDAIVVAAYDTSTGTVTAWHQSACGPGRRPDRSKPDIAAPGVDLRLVTAGTQDGCMRASGTSLAAPFVTGTIACLYEASPGAPLASHQGRLVQNSAQGARW